MNQELHPGWLLAVVLVLLVLVALFVLPSFYRSPGPHLERMKEEADACMKADTEACERLLELERQKYRR